MKFESILRDACLKETWRDVYKIWRREIGDLFLRKGLFIRPQVRLSEDKYSKLYYEDILLYWCPLRELRSKIHSKEMRFRELPEEERDTLRLLWNYRNNPEKIAAVFTAAILSCYIKSNEFQNNDVVYEVYYSADRVLKSIRKLGLPVSINMKEMQDCADIMNLVSNIIKTVKGIRSEMIFIAVER